MSGTSQSIQMASSAPALVQRWRGERDADSSCALDTLQVCGCLKAECI